MIDNFGAIVKLTPESSLIKKMNFSYYEKDGKRFSEKMYIYFVDGQEIEYSPNGMGIDFDFLNLFNEFCQAESVGKFWHKKIKGVLQYKKIK